jgi:hypothetical protein
MRHEQQTAAGIKTRVIQPGVAARQRNTRHDAQADDPSADDDVEGECAGRLT